MTEETLFSVTEPPVGSPQEEELLRQQAEAAGELNHIHPDLRRLAVRIIRLNLDPQNAQEHDKRNIESICFSLTQYGQRIPITVNWDDELVPGRITAGNGRYMAAKMMGWRWIAAISTTDDSPEALAWGLIDNRTSALSRVNYSQTSQSLRQLKAIEHPVLGIMFTDEEAMPLLREDFQVAGITDEEFDASQLRGRAVTKITAKERFVLDEAIKICREEEGKTLTEGECLILMLKPYLTSKNILIEETIITEPVVETTSEEEGMPE